MKVSTRASWFALFAVLIATYSLAPVLRGQEDAPVTEVAEEQPVDEEQPADEDIVFGTPDSLLRMILDSGATGVAFMGVLGLFSLVAATVTLERAVNLRRGAILPRQFIDDLQQLVAKQERRASVFAELCGSCKAPIATVLGAGLARYGHPLPEVEKAMEDAAAHEIAELRAKIKPLRTIGNVAPLVGLLGTVVGMIIAFHTASQAGLGKAELLAKGIYMALLTTAGGLSVAIPALMLGSFFSGRIDKYFREMDKHLIPAVPCLAQASTAGPPQTPEGDSPESSRQQNKLMSA